MVAEAFHGQTPEQVAHSMFLAEKSFWEREVDHSGNDGHVPDFGFRLNVLSRVLGIPRS